PVPHYQHSVIGYNYRLSDILAGLGRGQLKVLDRRIEQRRKIFEYYQKALGDLPGFEFMPEPEGFFSTHWLSCVLIDPVKFGATREEIRLKLEESNIESRPLWMPMHLQPVFKGCEYYGTGVSDRLFEIGLCLPSASSMSDADLEMTCSIIRSMQKK
ncbi:MAG: DegT/DnrJ/EryC1/StrS family aminotransferase, partial [bacterium]|nr:DegT/DnrJ/EryC1/StrS family aminotransferase [bacterium]